MVTFIALGISGAASNAIVHQRDTIVQVSHLPQTCYHNPRGPEGHPKSDGRPHILQHNIGNKVRQYVANMPSEWQKNTSITLPLPPVPSRNIQMSFEIEGVQRLCSSYESRRPFPARFFPLYFTLKTLYLTLFIARFSSAVAPEPFYCKTIIEMTQKANKELLS